MAIWHLCRQAAVALAWLVAMAGLVAVSTLFMRTEGEPASVKWEASLAMAALTGWAIGTAVWLRRRRVGPPAPPPEESIARTKEALAASVGRQWHTEADLRDVDDPAPVPVRWRLTGRRPLIDRSTDVPAGTLIARSDDIAALAAKFRGLRSHRLVILGGPGTGKTTLAVQLGRELLDTRSQYAEEPVPVLFSVADWDTSRHPTVRDWIAARLIRDYPNLAGGDSSGRGVLSELAARGRILPVLDGFDELAPRARAVVIVTLNRTMDSEDRLIVTCRTTEYVHAVQQAKAPLAGAVVIESEPIDRTVAAEYLTSCLPDPLRPAWEPVLSALRGPGSPVGPAALLAEVTTTALGLWLLRVAYCSAYGDPAPLLDVRRYSDAESMRAHLFDRFIPAVVNTRRPSGGAAGGLRRFIPAVVRIRGDGGDGGEAGAIPRPRRRHDPRKVRRYLGYLAHRLAAEPTSDGVRGVHDLAWWRLAGMTGGLGMASCGLLAILTASIYMVIFAAIGQEIQYERGHSPDGSVLVLAMVAATVPAVLVALSTRRVARDEPGFADLRSRKGAGLRARILVREFPLGLAIGLAMGAVVELSLTAGDVRYCSDDMPLCPIKGILEGVFVVGIPIGLALVIIAAGELPTLEARVNTPLENWRADRTLNLIRIITPGVTIGITFLIWNYAYLIYGRFGEHVENDKFIDSLTDYIGMAVAGSVLGVLIGLPIVFLFGRHRAWYAYIIASYRLALTRRLPRRLMPFLDDAYRLGLLRAVGPVYQFRHAELQDHLARTYKAAP